MGWLDGAIGSIGDALSNFGGLAADALTGGGYSTQQANAQNVQMNKENRDWSEKMSNSAYQRAMDDMRKAGLNPMLAYQQGGASTPSNTAPTVTPAKMGQGLANSAKDGMSLYGSLNNQKADTILKAESAETQKSQRTVNDSVATLNETMALKAAANARESNQRASQSFAETQRIHQDIPGVAAQSQTRQAESESRRMDTNLQRERYKTDKGAQKFDAIYDRVLKGIGPVTNAVKSFFPSININTNPKNSDKPYNLKQKHEQLNNSPNNPFRRK